jgi:hypothetical protein
MSDETGWLSELSLNLEERNILSDLVSPDTEVQAVAADLGPDKLWEAIQVTVRIYASTKKAQAQLKPVIGKLLIELEKFPEIYQSRGYRTFDEFMSLGGPQLLGMPRSECYRAKRLSATWPNLTPEDFSEIGEQKLYALSTFTSYSDPKAEHWLDVARASTHDQLLDTISQSGENTKGNLVPAQISFTTSLELKTAINEYFSNTAAQSVVGTSDRGSMLMAAIAVARSDWGV